jgi:ABC-type transport system involved in multi-copper enzyme maturation permease subunit
VDGIALNGQVDAPAAEPKTAGRSRYNNPIFGRELMTLLRSKKAFAILAVYVALSMAVVLGAWPRDVSQVIVQGEISRELFTLFAMAQTLLLALLVPATLGSSMTTEKEVGTLDLLLTTPLSASQILFGKLMSGLVYLVILLVTSSPAVLLCFLIGGLGYEDVLGLYLFLAVQAAAYGILSLTCSVFFHRTHTAIILSYLTVGPAGLGAWLLYGDGIQFLGSARMWALLEIGGAACVLLLFACWKRIRRPFVLVPRSIEEEDIRQQLGLIIQRDQFPDNLIAPPRRTGPLNDRVNPVLHKELEAEIYGSGTLFVRLVIQFGLLASFVAFLFVLSGGVREDRLSHPEWAYFAFLIGYVMIVGPSLATTSFTQEKEFATIDSLTLTLIPRRQIVLGKFLAIMRVVLALAGMNSVCFLIAIFLSSFAYLQVPALVVTVATATVFSVTLGMFLSFHAKTTTTSTITTYFLLFALFVGPPLLKLVFTRLFPRLDTAAFAWLDYLSPLLACRMEQGPADQWARLLPHALMFLPVSAVMLWWMAARFEVEMKKQAEQS